MTQGAGARRDRKSGADPPGRTAEDDAVTADEERPGAAASGGWRRYVLDDQIGFKLRQALQRHAAIFARRMLSELTTTQFAALAKLHEIEACSQNHLGRLTAMDVATVKGVIDRLKARGLVAVTRDLDDKRRSLLSLTEKGLTLVEEAEREGLGISDETLAPLTAPERAELLRLLGKIT